MINEKIKNKALKLIEPNIKTSYNSNDCIFVLNEIGDLIQEIDTFEKEKLVQKGVHYSEMLPKESVHKKEYKDFFIQCLNDTKEDVTKYIGILAEKILIDKGNDVILVSLARAGSPIGILVKRYLKNKYNIDIPHYSISIIRGKGLDENSLVYIMNKHKSSNIQFLDGWTGKGAITKTLDESCKEFYNKYNTKLDNSLAVLCDPSHSSSLYGTREDILIPSACLNSTVSGLVSRTIHSKELVKEDDYHYAKYYEKFEKEDLSNLFIDTISECFPKINNNDIHNDLCKFDKTKENIDNIGYKETERIQNIYKIDDINKVKPSLGETTRVLLRRVAKKILVKDIKDPKLKHILFLAKEKNIEIEEVSDMLYNCIGIIDNVE